MLNWRTMTATQKTIAAVLAALGLTAVYFVLRLSSSTDPPIIIGDGSIMIHYSGANLNSANELKISKLFHRVRSLSVVDNATGNTTQTIDMRGRDWILKSASDQVPIAPDASFFKTTVVATCPSSWQANGPDYTCVPGDGSQFTPATLTFSDGNCPGTAAPTCTLCPSMNCKIHLEYK